MKRVRITKKGIEEMVLKLAAGTEVKTALVEWGMTVGEAQRLLNGGTARRVIRDVRAMQALQRELAVGRLVPRAAEALERQMGAEAKAELQVRGALMVLGLAGHRGAKDKPEAEAAEPATTPVTARLTEEEMGLILKEEAEALEREDGERYAS